MMGQVVSRFADSVWDFYPYVPLDNVTPSAKRIDWRIVLPDGHKLTDPEHQHLLQSSKEFIWSLFSQPVEGRIRPGMMTLIAKVAYLIPLLRWMVQQGMARFADLVGRTRDYVPVARQLSDGRKAAETTVSCRLRMLEDLHHQWGKISDALHHHPWPQDSSCALAGIKVGNIHRKPKTEVLPAAIASRIAEAALEYVQKRSGHILAGLKAVDESMDDETRARRKRGHIALTHTYAAREAGFEGGTHLRTESIYLRTACYIVIDQFSGARDSEMMSLEEGCIVPGKSRDGSTDILWLHGTIYKTGVRPHKWLVPPVVEEAVTVLTQLTAPLRERLRREEVLLPERIPMAIASEKAHLLKRLHTIRKQKNSLFLNPGNQGEVSVLSGVHLNNNLREFCKHADIVDTDGRPYPLHSHQFRRTYAHFIARAELGDLLTLRDHFGHWSIDMTVYYADGGADNFEADLELLEMIANEKMGRQIEIIGDYLHTDTPVGNGGHWISAWRSAVRTASNKEVLIAEYAGSLVLTGTGHSWCVGSEHGTCCGGLCVFEPQMCVDCNHGLIGPDHRPVWEGIRDQQIEALALDDIGLGGRARAKTIIAEAEKILRRLDGLETA